MTTKKSIELVKEGFANGVANTNPLSEEDKQQMIENATKAFGMFLDALQCDWKNDPNSGGIPLTSMCSHHHQTIMGKVHVAYIPGKDSKVIGLSKLNRLVEHFGRRGAIQEQLTVAIHNAIDTIITDNNGVAVMIDATHNCVSCRGVKHGGASMKTSKLTGAFKEDAATRSEYYEFVRDY